MDTIRAFFAQQERFNVAVFTQYTFPREIQGGIAHACSSGFSLRMLIIVLILSSSCDPVADSCFSCDHVVTVFSPILVFLVPGPFLVGRTTLKISGCN